jgi:hypothetical protein
MPAMVRIVWPNAPTIVDPRRFPNIAATVAQLLALAHIVLAALKTHGSVNGPATPAVASSDADLVIPGQLAAVQGVLGRFKTTA